MDKLMNLLLSLGALWVLYVIVRGCIDLAKLPKGALADAMLSAKTNDDDFDYTAPHYSTALQRQRYLERNGRA